jgi:hypothetical protein
MAQGGGIKGVNFRFLLQDIYWLTGSSLTHFSYLKQMTGSVSFSKYAITLYGLLCTDPEGSDAKQNPKLIQVFLLPCPTHIAVW